jgi:hypothetical protein
MIGRAIQSHEQYEVEYRTIGQDGRLAWTWIEARAAFSLTSTRVSHFAMHPIRA